MLHVSGWKCSCPHNGSEQNCYIFTWVKLWATPNVRNTVVGLCHCRRFSMSGHWETAYVTVGFKITTKNGRSFCYCRALWVGVCTCQVRIKWQSLKTKENKGGRMCSSPSLAEVWVLITGGIPLNSITQNSPYHWPILCHRGTRWLSPEQGA